MKKSFGIIFLAAIILFTTGCKVRKMDTSDRVNIVCSIFPEYDWARNITGDDDTATTLTLLEKNGLDLHTYKPSETDIKIITECDVLFYTGGESDEWIREALKTSTKKQTVISFMDVLKNQNGKTEIEDEHIWLSIKNAEICCKYFTETLCLLAPDSAERYKTRMENYMEKLETMDSSFRSITAASKNKTLIFCDRFPFKYLVEDYGLNYYAAFSGCSAQTNTDEKTITFLSDKLIELNVPAVIVLENSDKKIAKTVIGNAKRPACDTLTMDSMQSVTLRQAFAGVSYISQMQKNLETIQKALK